MLVITVGTSPLNVLVSASRDMVDPPAQVKGLSSHDSLPVKEYVLCKQWPMLFLLDI